MITATRDVRVLPDFLINYRFGGEFTTFEQWRDKAQSWIGGRHAVCVDARDRVCGVGSHMMRARDEGAFPVRFYFPVLADDVNSNG